MGRIGPSPSFASRSLKTPAKLKKNYMRKFTKTKNCSSTNSSIKVKESGRINWLSKKGRDSLMSKPGGVTSTSRIYMKTSKTQIFTNYSKDSAKFQVLRFKLRTST